MVTCAKFIFISGKQFFILFYFILSKMLTWWRERCSIVKRPCFLHLLDRKDSKVGLQIGDFNLLNINLKTVLRNYWSFWRGFQIWWVLESSGESFLVFKVTTWWRERCMLKRNMWDSHVWPRLKTTKINKDMGKGSNEWPQNLVLWLNITESVILTVPFQHIITHCPTKSRQLKTPPQLMITRGYR